MISKLLARLVALLFERMKRYDDWLAELPGEDNDD